MAADRLTQAVRHQLGLGRLLPLGDAEDGAWLTEDAAATALRRAVASRFPGVRLGDVRLDLSDPGEAAEPSVPRPPSALGVGPLTLEADLAVAADGPLPALTTSLRHALLAAAERELGLELRTVNLRVSELLDAPEVPDGKERGQETPGGSGQGRAGDGEEGPSHESDDPAARAAAAVLAVPGVARLTPVLGSPLTGGGTTGRAVRVTDEAEGDGRHVLLQLAVAPGRRALDVARAARGAVARAAGGDAGSPMTVAVLVTGVDPA